MTESTQTAAENLDDVVADTVDSGPVDDLRAEHGASLEQIFRKVYR